MARFLEKVKPTNGRSLPVNPFSPWFKLYFSRCATTSGLSGSNSSKWEVSAAPSKFGTYGGTAEKFTKVKVVNGRGRGPDHLIIEKQDPRPLKRVQQKLPLVIKVISVQNYVKRNKLCFECFSVATFCFRLLSVKRWLSSWQTLNFTFLLAAR